MNLYKIPKGTEVFWFDRNGKIRDEISIRDWYFDMSESLDSLSLYVIILPYADPNIFSKVGTIFYVQQSEVVKL